MAYKPYPIMNLKTGKVTALEPWLLPQDAFETLRNCRLKRGVLEKRDGYVYFGQMVHVDTSDNSVSLETDPIISIFNYIEGATQNLVIADQSRLNRYVSGAVTDKDITAFADFGGGEVTVTSVGHGFVTGDIVTISGTTNYNGTFYITKIDADNFKITDTWVSDDATGTASQEAFEDITRNQIKYIGKVGQDTVPSPGDTVTGAVSGATGEVDTVVVDAGDIADDDARGTINFVNGSVTGTFQVEELNIGAGIVGDSVAANSDSELSGDSTDFLWVANWNDIAYITNGVDPLLKYDGENLTELTIDIDVDRGPTNDINSALLVFVVKERLVIFNTSEKGISYSQRARYSTIKDAQSWPQSNFTDAPTDDVIVSGGFIGDELYIIFERSIWRFAYTGDATTPFEWIRVDPDEGSNAKMSTTTVGGVQRMIGQTSIVGNDGQSVLSVDERIPDFQLDWEQESIPYGQSIQIKQERQIYFTYASDEATANADGNVYPDSALVYNYEEGNWCTFELPVHSLGSSFLSSDLTWETSSTWDEIDFSWNYRGSQTGFPTSLMGSQDGKVYQLNSGGSDDGSDIEFEALSGRWNPFIADGKEADLGRIDFFVDVDSGVSFDVELYLNTDTTPYDTHTIAATASQGSDDKVWHRIDVNAIARLHRIKITNNGTGNKPRIHAIVPYFDTAEGDLVG